ncbi:hypothetical protein DPQ33_08460 [Oceanidesulfovibrio indonesiensis]|uniref:DUF2927 domain-containing protein n=1 Tax=Oceanidesulfovibrio indonesiensis TaxID=54767 RepID=A0A7M3MFF6_9BACT|nr:hypothetical protein [Oceanidesulfovibrio indonesiensis]TVM17662.1 hypothetical protein DPQ33_08460 [Oceanidesulfovibrio indonesiensis]
MRRMIFLIILLCLVHGFSDSPAADTESGMISPAQMKAMADGAGNTTTAGERSEEPEHDTIFPLEEEYDGMEPSQRTLMRARKPASPVGVKGSSRDVDPLDHFLRVAFQDRVQQYALAQSGIGLDAPPGRLMRWEQAEIVYAVDNKGGEEAAAVIEAALAELSRILDERGVVLVERGHIPDIDIRIEEAPMTKGQTGQTTELVDRATGVLRRVEVQLYAETLTPATAFRHLLLALGLRGWAEPGADSMLWLPVEGTPPSERTTLSAIDTEALLLLYHPALAPGMTLEQALASLAESAPEVEVPEIPGVTAPAYEPRIRPDLREKERRRRGESR